MTDLIFQDPKGVAMAITIIGKNHLRFRTTERGMVTQTPFEGLTFNVSGIIKEFPDLAGQPIKDIKIQGVQRFKAHIEKMKSHKEIEEYLVSDLAKHGYKYLGKRRAGFRFEKNKNVN